MDDQRVESISSKLQALSEKELQSRVIIPLLRAWGYAVRDVSGMNQSGKDLVATREDIAQQTVMAVQIKKYKLAGRVDDPKSLPSVLNQLHQAAYERVADPRTGVLVQPNVVLFVSPYNVDETVFRANMDTWRELPAKNLRILEGENLVNELLAKCPIVLQCWDDQIGYHRLANDNDRLEESAAFPLSKRLSVRETYVEAAFAVFDTFRELLDQLHKGVDAVAAPCSEIEAGLGETARRAPITHKEEKQVKEHQAALRRIALALDVDMKSKAWKEAPIETTLIALADYCARFRDFLNRGVNEESEKCTDSTLLRRIPSLQYEVSRLVKEKLMLSQFPWVAPEPRKRLLELRDKLGGREFSFPGTHLPEVGPRLLVLGAPGAGKTTLLKMVCNRMYEQQTEKPPVLIRAMDIDEPDESGILAAIERRLREVDIKVDQTQLRVELGGGERRLLIDGLDEVADRTKLRIIKATVYKMLDKNPGLKLILSCRDSVDFSDWKQVPSVKLRPFTDRQLREFFRRFFEQEPAVAEELEEYLFSPDCAGLRDVVRTPMLAVLLCSLFHVGAERPATEVELYDQRFALFLGRWEQYKGIRPMPADIRKRYEMFLMNVGYIVHSSKSREFKTYVISEQARRFACSGYNRSTDSFIRDCVERGIFVEEGVQLFSFGHLTYQEFLCAKYFLFYGDKRELAEKLGDPW